MNTLKITYRLWRVCYVTGRLMGYGPATSALMALFAMRRIKITVKKGTP